MAEKATTKAVEKKAPAKKVEKKETALKAEFAIIEAGGKQHVVSVGDTLNVELMDEVKEGDKVEFDKVLMADDGKTAKVGTPYVSGAKVTATSMGVQKGKKLTIVRYKAKSNRDRRVGHRQHYTQVKIESL